MNTKTWIGGDNGDLELELTEEQFMSIPRGQDCSPEVKIIRQDPKVEEQLKRMSVESVKTYLFHFCCWEDDELNDHEENLDRLVWLACEDIRENINEESNQAENVSPVPRKLSDLLIQNKICVSIAEVRRLCAQGAVKQLSQPLDFDSQFYHPSVAPITIGKRKVINKMKASRTEWYNRQVANVIQIGISDIRNSIKNKCDCVEGIYTYKVEGIICYKLIDGSPIEYQLATIKIVDDSVLFYYKHEYGNITSFHHYALVQNVIEVIQNIIEDLEKE